MRQTIYEKPIAAPNQPHLACVLLLDTSGSMAGEAIKSLNAAINRFKENISQDEIAKKTIDVAIIEFNDTARVVQNFTPISSMEPVKLTAEGLTAMGAGINLAIDKVKERNRFYSSLGTPCFKPWIFLITDGVPTDSIEEAVVRIREEESKGTYGKLKFFALGVGDYDKDTLFRLTNRVLELNDYDFIGIFNWMSESMVAISVSSVGDEPALTAELPANARVVPSDW